MTKVILVTGATGRQGGAVVNALIAEQADVEILAVTRNPNSASAQKLSGKSPKIKLVKGNLDDPAGIFANAKGVASQPVWGVFSVQVRAPLVACLRLFLPKFNVRCRIPWEVGRPLRRKRNKGRH